LRHSRKVSRRFGGAVRRRVAAMAGRVVRWTCGRGHAGDVVTGNMSMSIEPTMTFHCFFCAKPFERDNHVYHGNPIAYRGTYIGRYMIEVCDGCHDGNPDGWEPDFETRLLAHLKATGLPIPKRNEKGRLPRCSDGPVSWRGGGAVDRR
jgi:hypothetical protein